ncbi:MAG: MFS transporter [Dehalococcoidia bacterium]|nr:MFS transporter [Dehalococcoidia bacterium]
MGGKKWGYEFTLVTVGWFGMGMLMFDRWVIGYLLPMIAPEFQLSFAQVGLIWLVYAIPFAVMNFVGGGLSDRLGRNIVLIPSLLFFSLMSLVTGLTRSFPLLALVRGLVGAGAGPYDPTIVAAISEEAAPSRRGLMMGLWQSSVPLMGSFVGPIAATQLALGLGDWRPVFFISFIPGLLITGAVWAFLREPPSVAARKAARTERAGGQAIGVKEIFRSPNVPWLTIIGFVIMLLVGSIISFGSLFFTQVTKFDMGTVGFILSGLGIGSFLGTVVMPGLSDRLGRRGVLGTGLFAMAILTILLTGLSAAGLMAPWLAFVFLFLIGFLGWGVLPIAISICPGEAVPLPVVGATIGLIVGAGEISGALMQVLGGGLADIYGLPVVLYLPAILTLIAGFLVLPMKETAPSLVKEETVQVV